MSDWQEMMGADVLTLGMAADEARRAALGTKVVTYLRVHEVEFGDGGGPDSTPTGLAGLPVPPGAAELRAYVLPSTIDGAIAVVRAMKLSAGARRVVAFSWAELTARGWTDPSIVRALVAAGLSDVAELPVDGVSDLTRAVKALASAGAEPRRVTMSHPLVDDRAEIIKRVQRVFEESPSLRRFAPLPRIAPVDKPTTGYEDVRMVALSRLALRGRSVEVDWQLYGPKLAQVALTFGADHLDSVSAFDDASLGPRRATVEDVERNIRAAGFEPKETR